MRTHRKRLSQALAIDQLETSFGTLLLAASQTGLCRLALPPDKEHQRFREWTQGYESGQKGINILAQAKDELHEYLAGRLRQFGVPLDLVGSPFFCQVWNALAKVPYGKTITYTELATQAKRPHAYRAAGAACALNPIPLIIPCHRAVGRNGSLTGFGGGLAMKEALLRMEGAGDNPWP